MYSIQSEHTAQQELALLSQQLMRMKRLLADQRRQAEEQLQKDQQEIARLSALEEELLSTRQQLENASHQQTELQSESAQERDRLTSALKWEEAEVLKLQDRLTQVQRECDAHAEELTRTKQHLESLHDTSAALREEHHNQKMQQQELQRTLEINRTEHALLLERTASMEQQLISSQQAETQLNDLLAKTVAERDTLRETLERRDLELTTAKQLCDERQQCIEQLLQRTHKLENLSDQVMSLEQEKQRLDENLGRARKSLEERESEIKAAQQHLAKKVKEVSQLSEKQEEAERRADRLQRDLSEARHALDTAKTEIGQVQKREKQLVEQLKEQTHATNATVARWESEYLKAVEIWKESEAEVKRLRSLEEKHRQIQQLFGEADRLVSHSSEPEVKAEPIQLASPPLPPADLSADALRLRNFPKSAVRLKQNLFD